MDTDLFFADPGENERQKARRERQFHTVEIPTLRLAGLSIQTLLVVFRQAVVPDGPLELFADFVDDIPQHLDLIGHGFDGVDETLDALSICVF